MEGEVRPFVLDGFLMPYQQEAVEFGWSKDGVHFWHPTGSGKTLTGIISGLSVGTGGRSRSSPISEPM
jgi:replicative superfamily II helicase